MVSKVINRKKIMFIITYTSNCSVQWAKYANSCVVFLAGLTVAASALPTRDSPPRPQWSPPPPHLDPDIVNIQQTHRTFEKNWRNMIRIVILKSLQNIMTGTDYPPYKLCTWLMHLHSYYKLQDAVHKGKQQLKWLLISYTYIAV